MRPAHSYHIVLTVAFTARLQRHVGHACAPVSGLVVRGNGRTERGVVSVHIVLVVTVGVAPVGPRGSAWERQREGGFAILVAKALDLLATLGVGR